MGGTRYHASVVEALILTIVRDRPSVSIDYSDEQDEYEVNVFYCFHHCTSQKSPWPLAKGFDADEF